MSTATTTKRKTTAKAPKKAAPEKVTFTADELTRAQRDAAAESLRKGSAAAWAEQVNRPPPAKNREPEVDAWIKKSRDHMDAHPERYVEAMTTIFVRCCRDYKPTGLGRLLPGLGYVMPLHAYAAMLTSEAFDRASIDGDFVQVFSNGGSWTVGRLPIGWSSIRLELDPRGTLVGPAETIKLIAAVNSAANLARNIVEGIVFDEYSPLHVGHGPAE
ncbi:MAG: hypothetical protein ACRC1K_23750 [Planctomycetia bacterium]